MDKLNYERTIFDIKVYDEGNKITIMTKHETPSLSGIMHSISYHEWIADKEDSSDTIKNFLRDDDIQRLLLRRILTCESVKTTECELVKK